MSAIIRTNRGGYLLPCVRAVAPRSLAVVPAYFWSSRSWTSAWVSVEASSTYRPAYWLGVWSTVLCARRTRILCRWNAWSSSPETSGWFPGRGATRWASAAGTCPRTFHKGNRCETTAVIIVIVITTVYAQR